MTKRLTRILLIRHTEHDFLLRRAIAGRQPGVHLNARGMQEAEQLGERLSILPIDAIYSGPLDRVRETAEPLARRMDLAVQIAPEFDEVEMGDWTNRTFAELDALPEWQRWNGFRSSTRPPSGESMQEVRQRVVTRLLGMQGQHSLVAIFSHGDAIRAALGYFLGQEIDHYARIEIDPGGLSLVELDGDWFRVRFMNAPAEGAAAINALVRADTKGY